MKNINEELLVNAQSVTSILGPKKSAIVMVVLGKELATKVMANMDENEIERLSTEIAQIGNVTAETRNDVLEEFVHLLEVYQHIVVGGADYAYEILCEAKGERYAREMINRVNNKLRTTGFDLLNLIEVSKLVQFLKREHPQTVALLLSHMDVAQAAQTLAMLSPEMQVDVSARIALMDNVSPDTLDLIEEVLILEIQRLYIEGKSQQIGGVKAVADILNHVDRTSERNILDNLERENPNLAMEIKDLMFVFEDMVLLDDSAMKVIMKKADSKRLTYALKNASDDIKEKFLNNMSERAAKMQLEELSYLQNVRLKDVEAAQRYLVDIVRTCECNGDIVINGRGGEIYV